MSFLSALGLFGTLSMLTIGGITLLTEQGYTFDLRRRSRRRGKDGRVGGRREEDRALAQG